MSKEKHIEEMARDVCDSIVWDQDGYAEVDCLATAKVLRLQGYRKQEWISVDERLPERNGRYLIIDDEGYMVVASWYKDGGWFIPICRANPVTHWMPLPKPPKMKGGAE